MSKNRKLATKCSIEERNKKGDNPDEAPAKKNMKVEIENDSHQHSYESRVSGHSTPIRRKEYTYNVEDSPELDYRCSPISLPCTQDGGNEIAWDWQVPGRSNSNENTKAQNSLVETPKRTKQLQKKRNSNSPLLQKPLKRKQVKMENIENIGKLTRELKALTEKMKSMQQTCENPTTVKEDSVKFEDEFRLLTELDIDSSDALSEVGINKDKPKTGVITVDSNHKKGSNYEDLFDDSIDDSMIKCSQEIEEKLNLCKSKGNDVLIMSTVTEETELSSKSENEIPYFTASNNSAESSKNSSVSKSSSSIGTSSRLKTYSNNSSKTTSSNASIRSSKDSSFLKSHFNSNVLNVRENDLSLFPDDSFDDCLATCMEDDKLLSKLAEYDFAVSNADNSLYHSRKTYKQGASNTMNNRKTSKSFVPKTVGTSHNVKSSSHGNSKLITNDLADDSGASYRSEAMQKSFTGNSPLENRKFFKTKSLSDQYFHQKKPTAVNGKTNQTVLSSDKRFQSNSFNLPVSNTSSIVKSQKPYGSNKFPSINGVENTHAVNRLEEKDAGNCTVKYKSTSNLYSIKEVAKDSQQVQCTPQEIERKRLEAKIRLDAKRKLQQNTRVVSTPSEVPVKKSVKR